MKMKRKHKLSPKQRELLARAVAGEDRIIPERYCPGPPAFIMPERRWWVPAGFLSVEGSAEYSSARALAARGLLKIDSVSPCPERPYGLGGYSITPRGRKELARCA